MRHIHTSLFTEEQKCLTEYAKHSGLRQGVWRSWKLPLSDGFCATALRGFRNWKFHTNPECKAFATTPLKRASLNCSKPPTFFLAWEEASHYTNKLTSHFGRLEFSYSQITFTYNWRKCADGATFNHEDCHAAANEESRHLSAINGPPWLKTRFQTLQSLATFCWTTSK